MFRIATWRERTRVWLCVSTDRPSTYYNVDIIEDTYAASLPPRAYGFFTMLRITLDIYIYSQAAPTSPPREHARVKTPSTNSPKFDPASTFAIEEFRRERTTRRMIAIHPSFSLQGEEEAQASCLVSQLRLGGHDNKVTTRPLLQDAPHYRA